MKILLLIISILLFAFTEGTSQVVKTPKNNYYKETKTFVQKDYTYQCDVLYQLQVTLYNKENKWTYEEQIYKSTGKCYAPSIYEEKKLNPIIDNYEMTRKVLSIIDNAFTQDMVEQLGEERLLTTMYLDPNTGKVAEVNFILTTTCPYAQIPISVYRDIEVKLKESVYYTPTSIGKQLNYIMLSWSQKPKGVFKIIEDPKAPVDYNKDLIIDPSGK